MSDSLPVLRDGIVITRAQVLAGAGFKPIEDTRRALQRTRQALSATKSRKQPDHFIRLQAAGMLFELADVRRVREEQHADSGRPLAIAIILDAGNGARAALPTDGVRVHLSRGADE